MFLFLILLLIPVTAYAQADYYQNTGFNLSGNPIICFIKPTDPNYPNIGSKMQGLVTDATDDWSNELNAGGTSHIPVWKINLIPSSPDVPISDLCNIVIQFQPAPLTNQQTADIVDPVGITTWNFETHTASIVIYYDMIDYNTSVTYSSDQVGLNPITQSEAVRNGGFIHYSGTPYYSNSLASDPQLNMAIRHELGHAFGLGHYIMSDTEMKEWDTGQIDPPSIMIPNLPPQGYNEFAITTIDIKQLKSLYSSSGFGGTISPQNTTQDTTQITQTTPPLPQPQTLPSPIPSWIKNNAKWWSQGQVSDDEFVKGIQYLVQDGIIQIPQTQASPSEGSQQIPQWVKNTAGWWADGQVSDADFVKAVQYLVSSGIITVS